MKPLKDMILGLFGKKPVEPAVEPTFKPEDIQMAFIVLSTEFLERLFKVMDFDVHVERRGENALSIEGRDAALVLGRHGDTLKAIEYMVNLCIRDTADIPRMRLDSDGYREKRAVSLERLALSAARKATERGVPIRLDPMSSWERRIIHLALKDNPDVVTESVGESPDRKVVVMPKVNPNENRTRAKRRYRR